MNVPEVPDDEIFVSEEQNEPRVSKRSYEPSQWVRDVAAGLLDPEPEDQDKNT